jgi:tRNA threonylcarbamoyladenosine biosynthesis protein TsaE
MAAKSLTIFLPDAAATYSLGMALGRSLPVGSVILLEGDLGSGKTTLVQGIGQALGITEPIVSPTFTLINEYSEGRLPLYHLDLYRLNSSEVEALGLEIYWEGVEIPLGVVAIEWAERLRYKPLDYLQIHLTHQADHSRQADLIPIGKLQLDHNQLLKQ